MSNRIFMFSPSACDTPPGSLAAMRSPSGPAGCRDIRSPARLGLVIGVMLAGRGALAQGRPAEVTSDTPEYCAELAGRIRAMEQRTREPLPRALQDLSDEGQRLCDHGQTRNGITRLRRVLLILRNMQD